MSDTEDRSRAPFVIPDVIAIKGYIVAAQHPINKRWKIGGASTNGVKCIIWDSPETAALAIRIANETGYTPKLLSVSGGLDVLED